MDTQGLLMVLFTGGTFLVGLLVLVVQMIVNIKK